MTTPSTASEILKTQPSPLCDATVLQSAEKFRSPLSQFQWPQLPPWPYPSHRMHQQFFFSLYPTFAFLLFCSFRTFLPTEKHSVLCIFLITKRVVVSLLRLFTVSVLKFKIRASPFESSPRTLPPQLTRSRHPHGTQELLLRLLHSWPDPVRKFLLRKTQTSTPLMKGCSAKR